MKSYKQEAGSMTNLPHNVPSAVTPRSNNETYAQFEFDMNYKNRSVATAVKIDLKWTTDLQEKWERILIISYHIIWTCAIIQT